MYHLGWEDSQLPRECNIHSEYGRLASRSNYPDRYSARLGSHLLGLTTGASSASSTRGSCRDMFRIMTANDRMWPAEISSSRTCSQYSGVGISTGSTLAEMFGPRWSRNNADEDMIARTTQHTYTQSGQKAMCLQTDFRLVLMTAMKWMQ